jgi:type I restriction enzyme M protein
VETSELQHALELMGFVEVAAEEYRFENSRGDVVRVFVNSVQPTKSKIDFGSAITVHHASASSLAKRENLVVLQCVVDLLRRGYEAEKIELEKTWLLGHARKGRLDIYLKSPSGDAYALIECKTWGREYAKLRNDTLEDGGQLLSYFVQERRSRALYLYTCRFGADHVDVLTEFIRADALSGTNLDELFYSWNRSFETDGIFHPDSSLYDDEYRGIRKQDLRELDRETGGEVFNGFAEILRRNVVSDKPNAFNKIFNLFLCKIADEDSHDDAEEMDFQWRVGEAGDNLIARLTALYERGVSEYLGIDVDPRHHEPISDFAFIDVYDTLTFDRNLRILREVVELLQVYQLKYTARNQYLGDFFEMLLNTGVKQEAGQFFTPVPLVRGILRSLPLASLINEKIEAHRVAILPYFVDFACGAGHFITEAMDETQAIANAIDVKRLKGNQKNRFIAGNDALLWAEEYVYGIERDYRLAKVTKIATFLNGDGDANIVNADGLGDFAAEPAFFGRLRSQKPTRRLAAFDVVVANPPFSIASFARDLENGPKNFRLFNYLTPASGEIECLFLERASQLLVDGGVAGIIFPISVLNNSRAIYAAARRLLQLDFSLVGILELREKTFIASSSTTVCLFLRRRRAADLTLAANDLLRMHSGKGAEVFAFLRDNEVDLDSLRVVLQQAASAADLIEQAYADDELARSFRLLLNRNHLCVVAFAGDTVNEQQRTLGYRFSTARGSEGLSLFRRSDGSIDSLLYEENDRDRADRVSTLVRENYDGRLKAVSTSLASHVAVVPDAELWRGDGSVRNPSSFLISAAKVASLSPYGDFIDELIGTLVPLGEWEEKGLVILKHGAVYSKSDEVPYETAKRVLTATNIDLVSRRVQIEGSRFLREDFPLVDEIRPRVGDILVCVTSGSLKHLGKTAICEEDLDAYVGGFLLIARPVDDFTRAVLKYNFLSFRFRRFIAGLKEQNITRLTLVKLRSFPLYVPGDPEDFLRILTENEKG